MTLILTNGLKLDCTLMASLLLIFSILQLINCMMKELTVKNWKPPFWILAIVTKSVIGELTISFRTIHRTRPCRISRKAWRNDLQGWQAKQGLEGLNAGAFGGFVE
jgi:hypothetical protein